MAVRLEELNRIAAERDELDRRVGFRVRPAVLEEASAVGHPAVSSSAVCRGDLERAVASSSTAEDES